jgi:polyisoprenoid-binding protein YceI
MIRAFFAITLAVLIVVQARAADTKYTINGENTKLTFVGTKPDGKHDGGFKKLSGTATVTDGDFTKLKIVVEIDCDSIYADDTKLTGHLKSPDFFGVKDHPKAEFKTTKIEKGEKTYTITGDLTMLGKTKSITFPASVSAAGETLSLSTTFQIDRTEWGMTYGKGKIDDKVTLNIAMTAKK